LPPTAPLAEIHARERVRGTNPMAFLAAHLVDARCFLGAMLGVRIANPIGDTLEEAGSADEVADLPSLDVLRAEWRRVSAQVGTALARITHEHWTATAEQRFPVPDRTVGGSVAFLLQHESYHVGQLALLRRQLGYPAMTYERHGEALA
jgi:uncharacterized damage-inducible protein DinB